MGVALVALLVSSCSTSRAVSPTSSIPPARQPVNVGAVPLVPISSSQRAMCQQAANQAHAPVPCPGLVPTPNPGSTYACGPPGIPTCGPPQIQETDGIFLWNQYDFQVPANYVGVPPAVPGGLSSTGRPLGHFVIYAGRNLTLSRSGGPVQPVPSYCTAVPGDAALVVHSGLAVLYECSDVWSRSSPELDVGNELLVWKQSGITCEVSFHGHSLLNQELDVIAARATSLVDPNRSCRTATYRRERVTYRAWLNGTTRAP